MSDSGSRVSLSVGRVHGDVRIVVRDAGRGINPEFLPHVFEAFRQADGASTRMHNGLGLGLAIVKYLTEHHGGAVHAESAGPGCGADVDSASCVIDACTLLDTKMPHIVVTDIAMPDQDGLALLRHLRARKGSPHAEKSLRDAGFHAYVRKPVDPLEFARVISTLQQSPIPAI